MTFRVAALYVDPAGPYPELVADWWDESKDAVGYPGMLPVVAHPPCGPWGSLWRFCKKQNPFLGIRAVEQVRQWGGLLEHPAHSRLWQWCGLPLPGAGRDRFGGETVEIAQGDYGHRAPKRTWLYAVRLGPCDQLGRVENMGHRERRLTPAPLAAMLCQWAEGAS